MMRLILSGCLAGALAMALPANGATTGPLRPYIDSLKRLSTQCRLQYRAVYSYPDKREERIAGRMFISNSNYLDSSNARYIFRNQDWLIAAEHTTRMLSVVSIPDWKARMGGNLDLDINTFLFPATEQGNAQSFRVRKIAGDSLMGIIELRQPDGQELSITLWYAPGSKIPSRYSGTLTYPADADPSAARMSIRFECYNVSSRVDARVFDAGRLIEVRGKRDARMKRFNNYLVYRRQP